MIRSRDIKQTKKSIKEICSKSEFTVQVSKLNKTVIKRHHRGYHREENFILYTIDIYKSLVF